MTTENSSPDADRILVGSASQDASVTAGHPGSSPEAAAVAGKPRLEMLEDMLAWLSATDLFLDIGAGHGDYTLPLAMRSGCSAIAFVSDAEHARALQASVDAADLRARVDVRLFGVTAAAGGETADVPDSAADRTVAGTLASALPALDDLQFQRRVRLVRLAMPGGAAEILAQSQRFLLRERPVLYIDSAEEHAPDALAEWLLEHGFVAEPDPAAPECLAFLPLDDIDPTIALERLTRNLADSGLRDDVTDILRGTQTYRDQVRRRLRSLSTALAEVEARQARNERTSLSMLQQRLAHIESENTRLKEELRVERERTRSLSRRNQSLTSNIAELRASASFQIGYRLLEAGRSPGKLLRLVPSLYRIYRDARKRRPDPGNRPVPARSNAAERPDTITPAPAFTPPERDDRTAALQPDDQHGGRSSLRVACILDDFSYVSFEHECHLTQLIPSNWRAEIEAAQPELLLVESAWRGKDELWGSGVGHTSDALKGIIDWCRARSIPTAFWNKEDPVHFQTFLNTATLFDHVFTTDLDCIHRYKASLGHDRVYLLPFAAQPSVHNPLELYQRRDAISFAGAYYARYPERNQDLEHLVTHLTTVKPIEIFDRNFGKNDPNYQFPDHYQPLIKGTLRPDEIDIAYKGYRYAINLNSIKQSQTMFARRVFELVASHTPVISNYARGVRNLFGDLVLATDSPGEVEQRLAAWSEDPERAAKLRAAALRKVMSEHTYRNRLDYITSKALETPCSSLTSRLPEKIVVLAPYRSTQEFERLAAMVRSQSLRAFTTIYLGDQPSALELRDGELAWTMEQWAENGMQWVARNAEWLACFCPQDFYGSHYLLDLALATTYSSADAITKSSDYSVISGAIRWQPNEDLFKATESVALRSALVRSGIVAADPALRETFMAEHELKQLERGLRIDPFEYCRDAHGARALPELEAQVCSDDGFDLGIPLADLSRIAERITAIPEPTAGPGFGPNALGDLFGSAATREVRIHLEGAALRIASTLDDGKHAYVYSEQLMPLSSLTSGDEIQLHLEATPGLSMSLVVLFVDAQQQRIGHCFVQPNTNAVQTVPAATTYARFGLRILGGGTAELRRLILGHKEALVPQMLSRADTLIITNNYPEYEDLYRNMFVHTRAAAYRALGERVEVFRLREHQSLGFYEFEGVDVATGSIDALKSVLSTCSYPRLLIHFLTPPLWEVLKRATGVSRLVIWAHGADLHAWHRRSAAFETHAQLEVAKADSEARLEFWRRVFREWPDHAHMVFVSRHFAEEAFEDIGLRLPDDRYSVIHNPIDTSLFAYVPKPVEQRTKILSIRPFASRLYANDLAVEAILALKEKPFFDELEFRIIGNGRLFEETLRPIRDLDNVIIEQRFLSHQEIAALHKEYGVFLCPSRCDTQGVSRDEAMSSGLVPITTRVSAIPEFVDESCGMLAPPDDGYALADAIERLYLDPALFQRMSAAAAQEVRGSRAQAMVIVKEIAIMSPQREHDGMPE